MSIRKKIILYFSTATIGLVGAVFLFVFTLFSEYREEEFQQEQKKKITSTLSFLTETRDIDESIIQAMDWITIHDFYDEKLLIYDENKSLIYSSIDDLPIMIAPQILEDLSETNKWFETKEGLYDVVGVYLKRGDKVYFGISKAYDAFGYSKLEFLKYTLFITFSVFSLIIVLISSYLSGKITSSVTNISRQINEYNFEGEFIPIQVKGSSDEISALGNRFNQLMKKMFDAFSFQKHAIQHISHELKTPIAILVSNFERMERETDPEQLQVLIQNQKEDTKNLGEIINYLMEISKSDSGENMSKSQIRVDDLIFDLIGELQTLHPGFSFSVTYENADAAEENLLINANERLIKSAILNLMVNCIQYSSEQKAYINLKSSLNPLKIDFINTGPVIHEHEKTFLFSHFFRGENSKGKRGFGLGLVFVAKTIALHGGNIEYSCPNNNTNIFSLSLPSLT
jgi:signal transduction histidine kinase